MITGKYKIVEYDHMLSGEGRVEVYDLVKGAENRTTSHAGEAFAYRTEYF